VGAVAELATTRKEVKYSMLAGTHIFQHIGMAIVGQWIGGRQHYSRVAVHGSWFWSSVTSRSLLGSVGLGTFGLCTLGLGFCKLGF